MRFLPVRRPGLRHEDATMTTQRPHLLRAAHRALAWRDAGLRLSEGWRQPPFASDTSRPHAFASLGEVVGALGSTRQQLLQVLLAQLPERLQRLYLLQGLLLLRSLGPLAAIRQNHLVLLGVL